MNKTILKIRMTPLTKYNYNKNSKNIQQDSKKKKRMNEFTSVSSK